jgi:hypothetical protein
MDEPVLLIVFAGKMILGAGGTLGGVTVQFLLLRVFVVRIVILVSLFSLHIISIVSGFGYNRAVSISYDVKSGAQLLGGSSGRDGGWQGRLILGAGGGRGAFS